MNEMPSVFSTRNPVAAKEHRCCECFTAIAVGEKHVYIAGLWDGDWQTHRRCAPCHELAVAAQCESGCWSDEGPWFTGLIEWLGMDDMKEWLGFEGVRECLVRFRDSGRAGNWMKDLGELLSQEAA